MEGPGRKRLLKFLLIILLVLTAIIFSLPYLIDLKDLKAYYLSRIEKETGLGIEVEDLRISLIPAGLRARGLKIYPDRQKKRPWIASDSLSLSLYILPLLRKEIRVKEVRMERPEVDITSGPEGRKETGKAPAGGGAGRGGDGTALPLFEVERIFLKDGTVRFKGGSIRDVDLEVKGLSLKEPFTYRLSFLTERGNIFSKGRVTPDPGRMGLRLSGVVGIGKTPVSAELNVEDLLTTPRFSLNLRYSGDMEEFASLLGLKGAYKGEVLVALKGGKDLIELKEGRIRVEGIELVASGLIRPAGPPLFDGTLTVRGRLDDLNGIYPLPLSGGPFEVAFKGRMDLQDPLGLKGRGSLKAETLSYSGRELKAIEASFSIRGRDLFFEDGRTLFGDMPLRFRGRAGFSPLRILLETSGDGGFEGIKDLLPNDLRLEGRARIRAVANGTPESIRLDGEADLRDASIFHPYIMKEGGVPLTVRAKALIGEEVVLEEGTVRLPGLRMDLKGRMDGKRIAGSIKGEASGRMGRYIPSLSDLELKDLRWVSRVDGPLEISRMEGTGRFSASGGSYQGISFSDLWGNLALKEGLLRVEDLTLRTFRGSIDGMGVVDLKGTLSYRASLKGKGLDLSMLTAPHGGFATGRLAFEADIEGGQDTGVLTGLKGAGRFQVERGSLKHLRLLNRAISVVRPGSRLPFDRFENLEGRFRLEGKKVTLLDTYLITPSGERVDVEGTLEPGRLDMKGKARVYMRGSLLDMARDEEGRVIIPFTVRGRPEDPEVRLDEEVLKGMIEKGIKKGLEKGFKKEGEGLIEDLFKGIKPLIP